MSESFLKLTALQCQFIPIDSMSTPLPNTPFPHCSYENPLITATSRSIIHDIYSLAGNFRAVDVPRPLAVLNTIFRLREQSGSQDWGNGSEVWFQGLRVWTEIGEITETESFGRYFIPVLFDQLLKCGATQMDTSVVS